MTKVYLAGPDIFMPRYPEKVERLKEMCGRLSLIPLIPGDDDLKDDSLKSQDAGEGKLKDAFHVVRRNADLVALSDVVIANLNPFRGFEPDSGTVFECGFAAALGKPVIGYLADLRELLLKAREAPFGPGPGSRGCQDGSVVEDFGQPLNIMIAIAANKLCGSLEEALEAAAAFKPGLFSNPLSQKQPKRFQNS